MRLDTSWPHVFRPPVHGGRHRHSRGTRARGLANVEFMVRERGKATETPEGSRRRLQWAGVKHPSGCGLERGNSFRESARPVLRKQAANEDCVECHPVTRLPSRNRITGAVATSAALFPPPWALRQAASWRRSRLLPGGRPRLIGLKVTSARYDLLSESRRVTDVSGKSCGAPHPSRPRDEDSRTA
jgi:hypothetical protein